MFPSSKRLDAPVLCSFQEAPLASSVGKLPVPSYPMLLFFKQRYILSLSLAITCARFRRFSCCQSLVSAAHSQEFCNFNLRSCLLFFSRVLISSTQNWDSVRTIPSPITNCMELKATAQRCSFRCWHDDILDEKSKTLCFAQQVHSYTRF